MPLPPTEELQPTLRTTLVRGRLTVLQDELNSIEALMGDGCALNCEGQWDRDLARLMNRLRFRQAALKHQIALTAMGREWTGDHVRGPAPADRNDGGYSRDARVSRPGGARAPVLRGRVRVRSKPRTERPRRTLRLSNALSARRA
jgi:hypothetical protein